MIRFGRCSICNERRWLPFVTPADPPFYPKDGGHHCESCEHWLLTGQAGGVCKHCGHPFAAHDRYDYCPWIEGGEDPTTQFEEA